MKLCYFPVNKWSPAEIQPILTTLNLHLIKKKNVLVLYASSLGNQTPLRKWTGWSEERLTHTYIKPNKRQFSSFAKIDLTKCFYMMADGSCINIYVECGKTGSEEKDFR